LFIIRPNNAVIRLEKNTAACHMSRADEETRLTGLRAACTKLDFYDEFRPASSASPT